MHFLFLVEIVVSAKDQCWTERSKERKMGGKMERSEEGIERK